ncbi:hypothetical protein ACIBEA_21085 [Streptomyces sp. NPDC051555]|uniref:hypothetical protein n=1 Tax=Streptomyces sp. NPDC051555 TaxID=3365657 RepID=UPI0037AF1A83
MDDDLIRLRWRTADEDELCRRRRLVMREFAEGHPIHLLPVSPDMDRVVKVLQRLPEEQRAEFLRALRRREYLVTGELWGARLPDRSHLLHRLPHSPPVAAVEKLLDQLPEGEKEAFIEDLRVREYVVTGEAWEPSFFVAEFSWWNFEGVRSPAGGKTTGKEADRRRRVVNDRLFDAGHPLHRLPRRPDPDQVARILGDLAEQDKQEFLDDLCLREVLVTGTTPKFSGEMRQLLPDYLPEDSWNFLHRLAARRGFQPQATWGWNHYLSLILDAQQDLERVGVGLHQIAALAGCPPVTPVATSAARRDDLAIRSRSEAADQAHTHRELKKWGARADASSIASRQAGEQSKDPARPPGEREDLHNKSVQSALKAKRATEKAKLAAATLGPLPYGLLSLAPSTPTAHGPAAPTTAPTTTTAPTSDLPTALLHEPVTSAATGIECSALAALTHWATKSPLTSASSYVLCSLGLTPSDAAKLPHIKWKGIDLNLANMQEIDVDLGKGGVIAIANDWGNSTRTVRRKKGLEILADATIPWHGELSGLSEAIEKRNIPEAFYQISKGLLVPVGIAVPWLGWGLAIFDIVKEQVTSRILKILDREAKDRQYDAAGATTMSRLTRIMEYEITQVALLELENSGTTPSFVEDVGRKLEKVGWYFAQQVTDLEAELWYIRRREVDGLTELTDRQKLLNKHRMQETHKAYVQAKRDIRLMVNQAKGLATSSVARDQLGEYGIPLPYPEPLPDPRPGFSVKERFVVPHPTDPDLALEIYNNEKVYRLRRRAYDRPDLIPGVDLTCSWERAGEEYKLNGRLKGAKPPYPQRTTAMAVPRAAYTYGGKLYETHQTIFWAGGKNEWTGDWTFTSYSGSNLDDARDLGLTAESRDALKWFGVTNMYLAPDSGHIIYVESELQMEYLKLNMADGSLLKRGRLDDTTDKEVPPDVRTKMRAAFGTDVTVKRVVNGAPSAPLQDLNLMYCTSTPCLEDTGAMKFARYSMREGRLLFTRNSPVSKAASLTVRKIEILGTEDTNGDETMGRIQIIARQGTTDLAKDLWSTAPGKYMTNMKAPYTLLDETGPYPSRRRRRVDQEQHLRVPPDHASGRLRSRRLVPERGRPALPGGPEAPLLAR